jgi:hypothetical protein
MGQRRAMEKVFASNNSAEVGLLKNLLEKNGISCVIRNEQLSMLSGAIPFTECYPELWVLNDEDSTRAKELLRGWRSTETPDRDSWVCPSCVEKIEGQFTACWKCGEPHTG